MASSYEAQFAEWAMSNGWDVTKRGWPDFICRRDGAIMAVEVKGGADQLTPEQIDVLDDLARSGLPVFVWYAELGLKEWRTKPRESVATLKLEIERLHGLIRGIIAVRDANLVSDTRKPTIAWSLDDELLTVISHCRATHRPEHWRSDSRMTVCAWIYYLQARGRTFRDIAELVGLHSETVQKEWRTARGLVLSEQHRQYHEVNGPDRCDDCGRDLKPRRPERSPHSHGSSYTGTSFCA